MQTFFFENKQINLKALEYCPKSEFELVIEKDSGFDLHWLLKKLETNSKTEVINLYSSDLKWLQERFNSFFVKKMAAGGLVQNREGAFLLILKNNHWDLPKGHLDDNETNEQAALREVEEECGIDNLEIVAQLPTTHHFFRSNNKWILKETNWFLMKTSTLKIPKSQLDEGISEARWVNQQELGSILEKTYASIRQLITSYLKTKS